MNISINTGNYSKIFMWSRLFSVNINVTCLQSGFCFHIAKYLVQLSQYLWVGVGVYWTNLSPKF